jgi:hypothetical protein
MEYMKNFQLVVELLSHWSYTYEIWYGVRP